MSNFIKLETRINNEYTNRVQAIAEQLRNATVTEVLNSWYLSSYATQTVKSDLQAMKDKGNAEMHVPVYMLDKMLRKVEREEAKQRNKELERVERAASVARPIGGRVTVEWKKNPTWGNNPTATVELWNGERCVVTTERASGCGYDKLSASIAYALNKNEMFLRLLYDKMEELLDKNGECTVKPERPSWQGGDKVFPFPYSVYVSSYAHAYMDGGYGVNCMESVFKYLDLQWKRTANGRTFDAFEITMNNEEA